MYCLVSFKILNKDLEWIHLDLWIWYVAKITVNLIIYHPLRFLLFVFVNTKQYIFPVQRKFRVSVICNILGHIFPKLLSVGTLTEQMQHCFWIHFTKWWVNTNVFLKPKKRMSCRIISTGMYDFQRNFPYFISEEIPNIFPIHVSDKSRPAGYSSSHNLDVLYSISIIR